ncbi:MAG TPA: helix-turn-helix domain-containing protein [Fulvivirga sp.]|nr:helix-turn-helix domain-containing protein [Fulvivirga sp.]
MQQLLLFGSIQGFLITLALIRIKHPLNRQSNYLFASLIAVVAAFLLISSQQQYFGAYPRSFLASYVLIYLYCPLYYFYIISLTKPERIFAPKSLIVIIPALVYLLLMLRYVGMSDLEVLNQIKTAPIDLVLADIISIAMNFYVLWSSWQILKYAKQESVVQNTGLNIFLVFHVALVVSNLAWCYFLLPKSVAGNLTMPFSLELVYFSMSGLIFVFSYVLIVKNHYFSSREYDSIRPYKNVVYPSEELSIISEKIVRTLSESKAYCDPNFSLDKLAECTEVDKFKLSYTINHTMKSSFTKLVNGYRIEEFIDLMGSENFNHYNMLGVANEAGFKTKSTFYKAFKEIKGLTPREYLSCKDKQLVNQYETA